MWCHNSAVSLHYLYLGSSCWSNFVTAAEQPFETRSVLFESLLCWILTLSKSEIFTAFTRKSDVSKNPKKREECSPLKWKHRTTLLKGKWTHLESGAIRRERCHSTFVMRRINIVLLMMVHWSLKPGLTIHWFISVLWIIDSRGSSQPALSTQTTKSTAGWSTLRSALRSSASLCSYPETLWVKQAAQ